MKKRVLGRRWLISISIIYGAHLYSINGVGIGRLGMRWIAPFFTYCEHLFTSYLVLPPSYFLNFLTNFVLLLEPPISIVGGDLLLSFV